MTTALDLRLLASLADAREPTVRELPTGARREYNRDAVRRHREAKKAAAAAGVVEPTKSNVRDALADAALVLLATDGPGAAEIRTILKKAFRDHPGTPFTVEADAKSGKLRPKVLKLR